MRALVRGVVVLLACTVALPTSVHLASGATPGSGAPQGEAFAWGANYAGQLGNGTDSTSDDTVPGLVLPGVNPTGRWTSVGAGGDFSCGIDATGAAFCWGSNSDGTLGNGTTNYTSDDSAPGALLPGDNSAGTWSFIDGGWNFNCGLGPNGAAYCWGKGSDGQLGTGFTADDSLPAAVVPGAKPVGDSWTHLSVGYGTACGIADGAAYCWGYNQNGGLGDGTTASSPSPVAVVGGKTWTTIATGDLHACGVTTAGDAYCWGWNADGQLGDGTQDDTTVPVKVDFGGTWTKIAAGAYNTCGITPQAELYCWGANSNGQLGQVTPGPFEATPMRVPGLSGVVDVQLGEDFVCATTQTSIYCWGKNDRGQIGNGTSGTPVLTPTEVVSDLFTGLTPASLALGSYHVLVVMALPSPPPAPDNPPMRASSPQDATAIAGDRSVAVSWEAPQSPGNFPVSHYVATSIPGSRSCLTTTSTCTISGLTNGTEYTFTVKALTGAGWSLASAPSNVVVPRAPERPSITITGSRDGKRIAITGTSTGLGMGAIVIPWTSRDGAAFVQRGDVLIGEDGTFTWSRKASQASTWRVYVTSGDVRSNTLRIR